MTERPLLGASVRGLAAAALAPLLDERARVLETLAATRPDVRAHMPAVRETFAAIRQAGAAYADWLRSANGRADVDCADVPESSDQKDQIGTTEAAGLLGCTPRHVRRLAEAGVLSGRKVGPAWLLDRVSIATYVEVTGGNGRAAVFAAQSG